MLIRFVKSLAKFIKVLDVHFARVSAMQICTYIAISLQLLTTNSHTEVNIFARQGESVCGRVETTRIQGMARQAW